MVVCIALGVDVVLRGSLPALIYPGGQGYMESPTTTQSGNFLCTAASSMPIRVVTREIRYIHVLSLTLEHSIHVSSPAAPGLTDTATHSQNTHTRSPEPDIGTCLDQL